MARAVLILATIVDLALAALLIGVSGFVFGPGPESMHSETLVAAGWTAMVVVCVVAPIVGFALRAFHRPVGGILIAWLPPIIALVAVTVPPPY